MHPLDALLMPHDAPRVADGEPEDAPLWEARVTCRPGNGPRQWLRVGAEELRVFTALGEDTAGPSVIRVRSGDGRTAAVRWSETRDALAVPFSFRDAYESFVFERYAADAARGLSAAQLATFYRVKRAIPRSLQLGARRLLIRLQGRPEFPRWPFDASVADLLRLYVRCLLLASGEDELRFRWFWPNRARACLVLTHDVESAAGLRGALAIADAEESRGFRSSFNVVASWYPIDDGILGELQGRGFEIGVHGVYHDRSLFSTRAEFERQLPDLSAAARRFGGAVGFRSPATHRVLDWMGELPFEYDSTVPLTDPYEPQPGGCCSPWPYFVDSVVELPWTMPQDHLLLTLLREKGPHLWLRQLDALEREAGLVQCLTHPDPGYLGDPPKLDVYTAFLDAVAERDGIWHALPRDVARWWRDRTRAAAPPTADEGVATTENGRVAWEPAP